MVLALVAFASASAYLTRYCISAANTTIQAEVGFDDAEMGKLMSAFMLGYLVFQAPGGWLANRLGTRLAFALMSVGWSLCSVWSAMAWGLAVMWASRFSLGAFQAGMAPTSAKILNDWLPLKVRGLSSALIVASMSVGGAATMWLTGQLLDEGWRWQSIFVAYSLVGVAWAVGFYLYFRTYPQDHARVNQLELEWIADAGGQFSPSEREPQDSSGDAVAPARQDSRQGRPLALGILRSLSMWGLCFQAFFRAAGYTFFVTWFFAFLEYAHGIDKADAGLLNSLPLMAVVAGSLAGGAIVDGLLRATGSKRISRSGTAIVALTASGLLTMASAWTSTAAQMSCVIAVGALFSGLGGPAAWGATIDIGGRHTAIAMATMNMAGCLAGVVLPAVLGSWFSQIKESGGNWDAVIYLHAGFYFLGAISWIAVDPNRSLS